MEIYLKPFCSVEVDSRYAIDSPFNVGGYTFATDGRIAIRIPSAEPDSQPVDKRRFPRMDGLEWFHDRYPASEWQPWPFPNYAKLGTALDECGDKTSDFQHSGNSSAYMRLEMPLANGELQPRICHIAIARDILIRAFLPNPQFICEPERDRVLIKFDGGEAILMALQIDRNDS
jgi:hypothetical protein